MGKSLFMLLLFAFSLAAITPSGARAATLYSGDYVSVDVPDLEQAVAFFQDVLDCRLIGPESVVAEAPTGGVPASRLLSCDAGSVVELFDNRGLSPSPASGRFERPLQFVSDDVQHASEWLRRTGVNVSGSPYRLTSGPLTGRMVLDFVSPWGLRLQLLGSDANAPASGSLATIDGG